MPGFKGFGPKALPFFKALKFHQTKAWFDENKLFRVIHNLARNAGQAMEDGGRFVITIDNDGPELTLSFADTGRGIPEAMQGRVFDAFATSGKHEGTGLGLAIVKHVMAAHNGRVAVRSVEGAGSAFTLFIPLRGEHGSNGTG